MNTTVTFNGYDLTQNYVVSELVRPFLPRSPQMIDVPARDGEIFTSAPLDSIEITMVLTAISNDDTERSDALRELAGVLNVSQPARLEISDDSGKYYLAVPSGGEVTRYIGAEQVPLTFTCPDPRMYGETQSVTVPSGGSVTFEVEGNSYTMPTIEASAVRDATSLVWGIRLDDADYIHIATGNAAARRVVCDCANRTLTIAGANALPTLSSDWLQLTPGEHRLTNDNGTGAATVTWVERWL